MVLGEDCRLTVVQADPTAYKALKPPVELMDTRPCWTVPALSAGVLYVRNTRKMMALRMAGR